MEEKTKVIFKIANGTEPAGTLLTKIYVQNIPKAEIIFNELFASYGITTAVLLKTEESFLIAPSSVGNVIARDMVLCCVTSPVCIDKSREGKPSLRGIDMDYKEDSEEDDEPQYVEEIEIHDSYIIQYWNFGAVEVGFLKDFMEQPYMAVYSSQDDRGNISFSVW